MAGRALWLVVRSAADVYLRATAPAPVTLESALVEMDESQAERDRELLKAVQAVESQADRTADEVCALRKEIGREFWCP